MQKLNKIKWTIFTFTRVLQENYQYCILLLNFKLVFYGICKLQRINMSTNRQTWAIGEYFSFNCSCIFATGTVFSFSILLKRTQPFISGNLKYIQSIVPSLVEIGTLVLRNKMKMWKVYYQDKQKTKKEVTYVI